MDSKPRGIQTTAPPFTMPNVFAHKKSASCHFGSRPSVISLDPKLSDTTLNCNPQRQTALLTIILLVSQVGRASRSKKKKKKEMTARISKHLGRVTRIPRHGFKFLFTPQAEPACILLLMTAKDPRWRETRGNGLQTYG